MSNEAKQNNPNRVSRFLNVLLKDAWWELKPIIQIVFWINVLAIALVAITVTGISVYEFFHGPIGSVTASVYNLIVLYGLAPYLLATSIFYLGKYIKTKWNLTANKEMK